MDNTTKYLEDGVGLLQANKYVNIFSLQLSIADFWSRELAKPRYDDPRHLARFGYKVYSQFDEDGIIAEIFNRIGTDTKKFVEFGVERGLECNTLKLLLEGWSGLWIDGSQTNIDQMTRTHGNFLNTGRLSLLCSFITAENINSLIGTAFAGGEIDLLSIDIDRNDFWVWKAIEVVKPRVVVIEYNATWRPPLSLTIPYAADQTWDGTSYTGASLEALRKLGKSKGYHLVGCGFSGVNAYFVRSDLCEDRFLDGWQTIDLYEPARYFMIHSTAGHPPNMGPLTLVGSSDT